MDDESDSTPDGSGLARRRVVGTLFGVAGLLFVPILVVLGGVTREEVQPATG